ncbi:MAG: type II toxin-antitoxin system Phd/YefM family antitoxin [bacterium]
MKTLNALTVRKRFGSVIDEVYTKKHPIVISRVNKPLVAMIPIEDYKEKYEGEGKERQLQLTAKKIDQWRKEHREELKGIDTTSIIRQMREEG